MSSLYITVIWLIYHYYVANISQVRIKQIGIALKEVMIKGFRYAQKQIGINAFAFEYLINICPVTIQLSAKPSCGSLLPQQFFLN